MVPNERLVDAVVQHVVELVLRPHRLLTELRQHQRRRLHHAAYGVLGQYIYPIHDTSRVQMRRTG